MRSTAILSVLATILAFASTARADGAADGEACGGPEECASSFCVDGVCCESACPSIPAACASGYMSTASSCATGACKAPQTIACAPYACGESECRTSCATAADCATGAECLAGACVSACASDDDCLGDAVCRSDSTCGPSGPAVASSAASEDGCAVGAPGGFASTFGALAALGALGAIRARRAARDRRGRQ